MAEAKGYSQRLLAQIHIAKKQLGMDDDTYRRMLHQVTGLHSCTGMSAQQLRDVLARLKASGFKVKAKRQGRATPQPAPDLAALMSKVEALLAEAVRPWAYADSMARHMFKIDRVEWLEAAQLEKLMVALIKDAGRHGRPEK